MEAAIQKKRRKKKRARRRVVKAPSVRDYKKFSINDLVRLMPNKAKLHEVLRGMAKEDPYIWAMYFRRLQKKAYSFTIGRKVDTFIKMLKNGDISEQQYKANLLRHRPFLIEPLRDQHRRKCFRKSRQVGVSELAITEELWFLWAHPYTKWIHTFPREKQLIDFSNSRISEAFNESPRMQELLTGVNQTFTKQVGESYLFLRSAWESNLGEGIDADGVTFDEKDRMRVGIEYAFIESLKSSPYALVREISTPSLPGKGVDETFQKSDQRHWFVKCKKCSTRQTIDYPASFMQLMDLPPSTKEIPDGAYRYACKRETCRGELDRAFGEWVAKYPGRKKFRGYQISQLAAAWISADDIMQNKIDYKYDVFFWNYVLGLPSVGGTHLITQLDIEDCISGHEPIKRRTKDWDFISIGIDWGHLNWIFVQGLNSHNSRRYLLDIMVFEDKKDDLSWIERDVVNYIKPFQPDIVVADGGYGKDRNAVLMKAFNQYKQVVFACDYNSAGPRSRTHVASWQPAASRVLVDRVTTLKGTCRSLKERQIGLHRFDRMIETLMVHYSHLAPMIIEDDDGMYEEIDRIGDDHLCHSHNYSNIGMDRLIEGHSGFSFSFEG